jgi:hypothetical protein
MQRKKIIQVYLKPEDGLRIYLMELSETNTHPKKKSSAEQIFGLEVKPSTYLHELISITFENFNHTKFNLQHHWSSSILKSDCYPFTSYECNELSIKLPDNEKMLLEFLGCIDGTISALAYNEKNNGRSLDIQYCGQHIEFENKSAIVRCAFDPNVIHPIPKQRLSVYLATWLIETVKHNPLRYAEYAQAVLELPLLLATNHPSLSNIIRQKLYPDTDLNQHIADMCKDNKMMALLFDTNLHHAVKTEQLISYLRQMIKDADSTLTEASDPANKLQKQQRWSALTAWFKELEKRQKEIWDTMIKSLFRHEADDGNYYSDEYGEIGLMREAKFHLNHEGLMEFDVQHTYHYKRDYAPNKENHGIFDIELKKACRLLNLEFLPMPDFHKKIIFTKDSTTYLMNRGFHYSEKYCKALMVTSNRAALLAQMPNEFRNIKPLWLHFLTPILPIRQVEKISQEKRLIAPRQAKK